MSQSIATKVFVRQEMQSHVVDPMLSSQMLE